MKIIKKGRHLLICGLILALAPFAQAYNTIGSWSAGEATFHTAPLSTSGSGLSGAQLQSAFIQALGRWTNSTNFTYRTTAGSANPCSNPNSANPINGYSFASNFCGSSFGSSTLAVARNWYDGSGSITQSSIVYNSAKNWNIYSGPQSANSGFDFTRVTVHEAGHSLGLGHSQFSSAIMWFSIGDIEGPQTDDLNGAAFLYGLAVSPANAYFIPAILLLLLDD